MTGLVSMVTGALLKPAFVTCPEPFSESTRGPEEIIENQRVEPQFSPANTPNLRNEMTEVARESKVRTRQKLRAHTERANSCLSNYLNPGKMRWGHRMERMRMITDNGAVFHLQ